MCSIWMPLDFIGRIAILTGGVIGHRVTAGESPPFLAGQD